MIFEHLGDVMAAQGRTEEAVEAWKSALEADPEAEGVADKIDRALSAPDEGRSGGGDR